MASNYTSRSTTGPPGNRPAHSWPTHLPSVTLERIAQGGEAVGRHEGRVVFVRGGLPGEVVSVHLTQTRSRYARGVVDEVLRAAPERVEPRCALFGKCGGCHWQFIAYPAQIVFKQTILKEQCHRIGHIEDAPVLPALGMTDPWGYRAKAQLHLAPDGLAGFYAWNSHEVIPLERCPLLVPKINRVLPLLRGAQGLRPADRPSQITLRYSWAEDTCLTILHGGTRRGALALLEYLSDQIREIAWENGRRTEILSGKGFLLETLGTTSLRVSPDSFFQANVPQTQRLVHILGECLGIRPSDRLLDAYAGVGALSLPLASLVKQVTAIEAHAMAASDCARNAVQLGLANVEVLEGSVERVLPTLDRRFDLVILDPPRRGCHERALEAVVQCRPRSVAYVSCHPGTLARDLGLLRAWGYHPRQILPVDLFPQTFHVESLSVLDQTDSPGRSTPTASPPRFAETASRPGQDRRSPH